jgi:hypothetical protein
MKKLFAFLIVLALLAVWVKPAGAITWGELDTKHTNVGAILIINPDYGIVGWCSGTLIAPKVILTAGHCMNAMKYFPIEWMFFALGDNVFLSEHYPVEKYIVHPDYVDHPDMLIPAQRSDNHDLAVVILYDPVSNDITPATLPEEGFLDELRSAGQLRQGSNGGMFKVVGYGATIDFPPPVQNIDGWRRSTDSEFLSLLPARLHTSTNQALGNGGGCFMDSGGPAFWTMPDGTEILIGVLASAAPCVASQFHYRIDTADSLAFIEEMIAEIP